LLFFFGMSLLLGLVAIPLASINAETSSAPDLGLVAQGGPTATPNDPNWLGFSVARDALSAKLKTRIQWVNRYNWIQSEFPTGMATGCTDDFPEGVEPPAVYFGWRYIITLLNNNVYEVRVSFDLQDVIICDEVTQAESSGGPAAPPGQVAAGNLEIGAQVPNNLGAEELKYLAQAKAKWVKIQAKDGEDWCGFIGNAHAQGFKVLASVLGDPTRVMNAAYHTSFANYLAGLAKCGADAIEVHNEPNIDREWPAGQISGANYTALLKVAYPAIKAANANTIVITAAPAPTGFFGAAGCTAQGCNDDVFYRQMAEAGAAQYANCIGVHYNEGVVSPKQNSGDPRDNYPTRYFQGNLARALAPFPGMRACFTEIGYLSPEGYGALPGAFAWGANTSVVEQAQWLAEAAVLGSQLGNVRLMIIFNLNFKVYGADPQAGYAMVRPAPVTAGPYTNDLCPACTALAGVQK
jgi:hypothetical protein